MSLKNSEILILAKRYASALFGALDSKSVDKASVELADIFELIEKDENFSRLINSPVFSKEDKAKALEQFAAKAKLSEKVKNLLLVLAENSRLQVLPAVCEAFSNIVMESKGFVKAEVVSAKKLKEAELKKITETISKATGKKVECENLVDEAIIGGLTVKIGSKLIDNSISGRLDRLKLKLAG